MVGNGELSLRTKDVMIKICEKNSVTEQIWEDIYFMKHMKGVGVADVYSPNPLGVHNPIRHIEPNLLEKVLFKNI